MATSRTLTEDHQVTRQNVRPFNRDCHGYAEIVRRQIVHWSILDSTTRMDIHRIIQNGARDFRHVVFGNRRDNPWFLFEIQRGGGQSTGRFQQVG
ncbi:Uncharacterised protein [Vibrio cholerae]|nr:Uncharacterised protein [Vibrio cholerae]CSA46553.1 Uncharacterised protein [Vibrio cholerae]CSB88216.1 Uncharacterised protein [Vibrio cholerae]CSC49996.1 Uncharacterised protein [Vibrio cholerae]CSC95798.1 Uncharacterised protein [Vibrio cholerae]